MFFHYITDLSWGSHEATACLENGMYSVHSLCPITGRRHTHFFDNLREFVLWHYADRNHAIFDYDYPFEREVKVLYDPPTEEEIIYVLQQLQSSWNTPAQGPFEKIEPAHPHLVPYTPPCFPTQ
jgi:hypothetical protein